MNLEEHRIVAFNDPYHDSSFCIYSDNALIHVEVERFTRQKFETENPIIAFCELYPTYADRFSCIAFEEGDFLAPLIRKALKAGNCLIDDCDSLISQVQAASAEPLRPDSRPRLPRRMNVEAIQRFFRHIIGGDTQVYFVGHHEAHAANAFFSSGLESALTITLDGGGYDYQLESTATNGRIEIYGSVYDCSGTSLRRVTYLQTSSFGIAWERMTNLMGLPWGEEGTVMAMAAFGDPTRFMPLLRQSYLWLPQWLYLSRTSAIALGQFLEATRQKISTDRDRFDMAAALQAETERRIKNYLREFITNDVHDVCVSGGLFLNCQILGKLKKWFPQLRTIFIPPAPYDGGVSIGAAQLLIHGKLGVPVPRTASLAPFSMGSTYSKEEIISACVNHGFTPQFAQDDDVIQLLCEGKIYGLFSGSAESGRRALGHRSIIADPRKTDMRDRINAVIKHRQWFRPLAPMVLAEHIREWFYCDERFSSPYMSYAIPIKEEMKHLVPAIVHADGTARVQTVHRELSPTVHKFLSRWHARTKVPLLINTSFNDREPIVQTPGDALETFRKAALDGVYFIDYGIVVKRNEQALKPA